jgi:hypothetical protein
VCYQIEDFPEVYDQTMPGVYDRTIPEVYDQTIPVQSQTAAKDPDGKLLKRIKKVLLGSRQAKTAKYTDVVAIPKLGDFSNKHELREYLDSGPLPASTQSRTLIADNDPDADALYCQEENMWNDIRELQWYPMRELPAYGEIMSSTIIEDAEPDRIGKGKAKAIDPPNSDNFDVGMQLPNIKTRSNIRPEDVWLYTPRSCTSCGVFGTLPLHYCTTCKQMRINICSACYSSDYDYCQRHGHNVVHRNHLESLPISAGERTIPRESLSEFPETRRGPEANGLGPQTFDLLLVQLRADMMDHRAHEREQAEAFRAAELNLLTLVTDKEARLALEDEKALRYATVHDRQDQPDRAGGHEALIRRIRQSEVQRDRARERSQARMLPGDREECERPKISLDIHSPKDHTVPEELLETRERIVSSRENIMAVKERDLALRERELAVRIREASLRERELSLQIQEMSLQGQELSASQLLAMTQQARSNHDADLSVSVSSERTSPPMEKQESTCSEQSGTILDHALVPDTENALARANPRIAPIETRVSQLSDNNEKHDLLKLSKQLANQIVASLFVFRGKGVRSCPAQKRTHSGRATHATSKAKTTPSQLPITRKVADRYVNHDDDHEGDQSTDDDSRKRRKKVQTLRTRPHRLLACPYSKFDPYRYSERNLDELDYRRCSSHCLRDISRLKYVLISGN